MSVTTAMALGKLDMLPLNWIFEQTINALDRNNWLFAGYPGGDGHILYTLNALQILL